MAINLLDITTNDNDLTNSNATEVTTSLPFAASTKAVDMVRASAQALWAADSPSLSITGDLTIEFWVKFTSVPTLNTGMRLVSKIGDAGDGDWSYDFYYVNDTNVLYLETNISPDGNAADQSFIKQAWTASTDTWYHVAWVFTAASKKYQFFINGSQIGVDQTGTATSIYNCNSTLCLGAYNADVSPSQTLDGKMDDVRIWNTARTGTQINDNKAVELVGNESGLAAYWPFETIGSPSASISLSPSFSPSLSPSASVSPSLSPSLSLSLSVSPSLSLSLSPSLSPSATPSVSFSASPSISISLSPSLGYQVYTRGDYAVLPGDDDDLETTYSVQDETNVATSDNVRVGQTGTLQYMVHQFKDFVGGETYCTIEWEGQSSLAPTLSTIYLQIYNYSLDFWGLPIGWETIDSDNTSSIDTDFILTANVPDLTNYKDASNIISCRVYQLAL